MIEAKLPGIGAMLAAVACLLLAVLPAAFGAVASTELCSTCSALASSSSTTAAAPVSECLAGPSPQCCAAIKSAYTETDLKCLCFEQVNPTIRKI